LLAETTTESSLFGIAAIITALGGVVTTVVAHRKGKSEATEKAAQECHERVTALRKESEQLGEELHQLKMERLG